MNINTNTKKWITVIFHMLAWMIVFVLPLLFRYFYDDGARHNPENNGFSYLQFLTGLLWVGTFYLNALVLSPLFIYKKKIGLYTVIILGWYAIVLSLHSIFFHLFISSRPFRFADSLFFNLPPFVLTLGASIAYRMLGDKAKNEVREQQKQEENLKTELSFLRSQISPHFVFNILNNIIALARLKSDQLEPTVMKLSSLMRYMLYETDAEKVSLQNETEYLRNYIDLQQQRFGEKVRIDSSFEVPVGCSYEIEPMLLIPFVENAFKHGVGLIHDPAITIRLHVKDNILYFSVNNKYNDSSTETRDNIKGIGLPNVKRRLNLLYQKNYTLQISEKDGLFSVSLELNLR
ncbi:MAG: histidine kinase [Chitinophagaceae bacterium]|nr:histidine kinase [Chitinophagaceae bacterium]MCB9054822.1 histidine kinase [Chitinophagales bacterium]